ncbi:MAG TPA: ABC transporter ATP-binding protein [Bacteroidota bacterium]|nr:ABC transporter ATP-binding protein [Bacteroidota bacterium]
MTRKPVLIRGEDLWKSYPTGKDQTLEVLKGVDLEVRQGEIVVIVGPSGSGKSTLLHLLGGLDRPTKGRVVVGGVDLFSFSDEQLAKYRNKRLGFVFQFHHLLPEFTALENVAMPSLIMGKPLKQCRKHALDLLLDVGLQDRQEHKPAELSGGEQQRVAVARALMNDPDIVLADEPSGNLDMENGLRLHKLLVQLARKRGTAFVIATHNHDLAKRGDRILRITDGKLVHAGRGKETE